MKFCVHCNNMYYIKIDEKDSNKLAYYCRHCQHNDLLNEGDSICVMNTQLDKGSVVSNTINVVNKYTKSDPTLPRIFTLPCPNKECITNTVPDSEREVLYIRYDDKNLKYMYMCCKCDTSWK